IEDNFFELGGDSILIMKLMTAIHKKFSIQLPMNVLFEYPTISNLEKYLQVLMLDAEEPESNESFEI
ncbi:MAG: acyl carrier protein, partial [Flavobacteriales bacterium]|nr:acyl carrier protein [Flavobacteriales bacterium]